MPVTLAPVDRPDAVLVTSVERLRGRRFRCVILGGLTADEFPRPAREDAFSSRRLRSQLALYGVELPQSPTLEDERLMFYQAVTRAQERLVLSWQSHDADGAPRRPSVFLQELLDLYRTNPSDDGLPQGLPRRALSLDELREPEAAPSTDRRILRRLAASGQEATWAEGAERLAHARYRARSRPDRLGPTTRAELASREVFTATEIEAYLHCPFRWYVDHVLHPSELDVEVDAAASGRIAHMILRRVYDEMEARVGARRITPETVTAALEIHTVVAEGVTQSVPSSGPAETANIRRVVRDTARVIAGDATFLPGFEPRYREWSFGLAEGDAPEPLGDFALAGRVDRIDTDGRRLVIVDYKSGRVSSERGRKRLITDGLVQLPLYAAVASRRLGLEVAGGLYRGVREGVRGFLTSGVEQEEPPIVSTDRVNEDDVQELMRQAVARAAEAVAGIRAGEIPARPLHGRCPAWCSARPLCRRSGEACE
jgi:ATP-dependent helicase/DNAse subunit B